MSEPSRNEQYDRDRDRAEADGTALPEVEGNRDVPPGDLFHAARALAKALGSGLPDLLDTIGLPDSDPARWERLDVARAATYLGETRPDDLVMLTDEFPWLAEHAASAGERF